MKNFFLIFGWAILLGVLFVNRLIQPISDGIVVLLCFLSLLFLIMGIVIQKKK